MPDDFDQRQARRAETFVRQAIGGHGTAGVPLSRRLSTRLLWLTLLSVMAAEVLIFVPSIANFRKDWLTRKIETAAVAGLTAEQANVANGVILGPAQQAALLSAMNAQLIAIVNGGTARLLAREDEVGPIDREVNLGDQTSTDLIMGAFDTLFFGGDRTMRVLGPVGDEAMRAEVVIPERKLRLAMLLYSRNIFVLSLAIASFAALLVYIAISLLLIRPIQRMTRSMVEFSQNPADADRIIMPSERRDEIGMAEAELAAMQKALAGTLREQRHLADLGLAVSKINHDLRNVLASAQLISDRLSDLPDPRVQRFAPLLIRSLDRALSYTQSVLAYGRAVESQPVRRRVVLRRLVEDVLETVAVTPDAGIDIVNDVPEGLEVDVDPDQFYRVIANLCRNGLQALEGEAGEALVRRLTVSAQAPAESGVRIVVEDTGPGVPERARDHLFEAFRGSARAGGTGLGLAIAAEIVEAHGGTITLAATAGPGARFEIRLPRRGGPDRPR